ncbi:AsmA family protein [Undibacterium sp. LX40W]|uniref:AsmA family protein n=1 Tax=Undibacterium nitidum TaxID=2762298 RepID=A0A923KKS4_9BURK|nr:MULTISPECIES: AsmA family protein [Undibacterium]MBC3881085.1 AsmA family protein [Undibacterium nitidum]MBC3890182.1 AsmA family protein [Undibacterium sp. LX40W]
MPRILKYLMIGFGVIIALLGLIVVYLSFAFDPNQFKTQIIQTVEQKQQRHLSINGNIGLRFFPKLGVELENVALSEFQSTKEFASLSKVRVSLAFLPLLRKQIVIDKVALHDLKLQYERDTDGKSNIDDLIDSKRSEAKDTQQANSENVKNAVQFEVEGIEIKNAQIRIKDEKAKVQGQISSFNLNTGKLSNHSNTPFKLDTRLQLEQPKLDAQLQMSSEIQLSLADANYALKDFKLDLQAQLEKEVAKLNISSPLLGKDAGAWFTDGIDIQASVNESKNSSDVKLKANTGKLIGKSPQLRFEQVQVNLQQQKGKATSTVNLVSAISLDTAQSLFELRGLKIDALIKDPSLAQSEIRIPLEGNIRLSLEQKKLDAHLRSQFDESRIDTSVSVSDFTHPMIQFKLAVDQLNLDRYLKNDTSKAASDSEPEQKPIDLSVLNKLNVQGQIELRRLQAKNLHFTEIVLPLKIQAGELQVTDMRAQLYQGSIQGKINVSSNNKIKVSQSLNNININPLLKDFMQKDILEGRGNLSLNIDTYGKFSSDFKKNINGVVAAKLTDGAVKGINLAKSLRDFKAKILNKSDQQQAANSAEKTDFSALSASIVFNDGIGKSDDLDMKSPFLRVGGIGTVNLRENKLDYTARVMVVNTATGQDGTDLSQLKDISIPVRLSGPFEQLSYQILFAQIGSDALKTAFKAKAAPVLEEKKQELKQKVNDQLKDKLKGLLNR